MIQSHRSRGAALTASVTLGAFALSAGGCKARAFNSNAKKANFIDVDKPEKAKALASDYRINALDRGACLQLLKEELWGEKATTDSSAKQVLQFLYCKDTVTANLERSASLCVQRKVSSKILAAVKKNDSSADYISHSIGYLIGDREYSVVNERRMSLASALPDFLNFEEQDPEKRKRAAELFLGLYDSGRVKATFDTISDLAKTNNADPVKPRVKVAMYKTETTAGAGGGSTYMRFMTVKEDGECSYLTNLVPAAPATAGRTYSLSAIATHVICDHKALKRVDGKQVNGVWLYNWRPETLKDALPVYSVQRANDGNCYKCHFSRARYINLDVDNKFEMDQTTKDTIAYMHSWQSRFSKPADFVSEVLVGEETRHVAGVSKHDGMLPTYVKLKGEDDAALFKQRSELLFKVAPTVEGSELAEKKKLHVQMNACAGCHSSDEKSLAQAPLHVDRSAMSGGAANWPLVLAEQHPGYKYHKSYDRKLFQFLEMETKFDYHRERVKQAAEAECNGVLDNPELAFMSR